MHLWTRLSTTSLTIFVWFQYYLHWHDMLWLISISGHATASCCKHLYVANCCHHWVIHMLGPAVLWKSADPNKGTWTAWQTSRTTPCPNSEEDVTKAKMSDDLKKGWRYTFVFSINKYRDNSPAHVQSAYPWEVFVLSSFTDFSVGQILHALQFSNRSSTWTNPQFTS